MSNVDNSKPKKVTGATVRVAQPKPKVVKPRVSTPDTKDEVKKKRSDKSSLAKEVVENSNVGIEGKNPKEVKKKKWLVPLIISLFVLLVAGVVALLFFIQKDKERKAYEESLIVHKQQTSGYTLDCYISALNRFDLDALSNGSVVSDCTIDDELLMVNNNEKTEQFIKWVCSNISLSGQDYNTKLENPSVEMTCFMSVIDYHSLASNIDAEVVSKLMEKHNLKPTDVDFALRIQDVFCDYMFSLEDVPTIDTEVRFVLTRVDVPIEDSPYYYVVSSDKDLDTVLFCSGDLHILFDEFAKVAVGWTGFKTETYIDKEEQENPAYVDWLTKLNEQIAKYPNWRNNSKCLYEPYYLRDENNKIVKDENGERVVNFYVLFEPDANGKKVKDSSSQYGYKYIPEPEKTIWVDVEKERQVEDTWVSGSVFPYSWIGYWYVLENELPVRYGTGTRDYPLGKGTWYPTKLTLSDGTLVDAKIELVESYVGADAVQKALSMSEKNRGLDSGSVVQLVICEFLITNTSESSITFSPDMVLIDQYGNKLSRTGTIYGIPDIITIGAGESASVVDWCTSTDLLRYQVAWGRSFDVETSNIFFDVVK